VLRPLIHPSFAFESRAYRTPLALASLSALLAWLATTACSRVARETVVGTERIGWDQEAPTPAELGLYRYAAYVDGMRVALSNVECGASRSATGHPCSAALPPLTPGRHTLQLVAWRTVNGTVLESRGSAPLTIMVVRQPSRLEGLTAPPSQASIDGVLPREPALTLSAFPVRGKAALFGGLPIQAAFAQNHDPADTQAEPVPVDPKAIVFSHDGRETDGYALYVRRGRDPEQRIDLGALTPGSDGTISIPVPKLSRGTYTVELVAYNAGGESPRMPAAPPRIRIERNAAAPEPSPQHRGGFLRWLWRTIVGADDAPLDLTGSQPRPGSSSPRR